MLHRKLTIAAAALVLASAGCATVAPVLTSLAMSFASDVISSASVNYTPRYATQVESLLVSLVNETTGLPVQEQLAQSGYRPPRPDYGEDDYDESNDDSYYGDDYEESYYEDDGYYEDTGGIVLDATVLVRRASRETIEVLEDGGVVYDGEGDPARGDLLRFYARANCDCYLYVIGIDATGFVAQIFPDPESGLSNPVSAHQDYVFPVDNQWWGLDDQAGVEQLYFVASMSPQPEILQAARALRGNVKSPVTTARRNVREPAIIRTRGLVKVQAGPVSVGANGTAAEFRPDSFSGPEDGASITVTRWFHHE